MSKDLLFEVSPIEDEDSKKRKPSKRKKAADDGDHQGEYVADYMAGYSPGFMASIDSVNCGQCGAPVDLVEIRKSSWLVTCGWWCMHRWEIDPVPGVLDKQDPKPKTSEEFVLRYGVHAGKTLRELWESGHQAYVRSLPKLAKQASVAAAASDWLAKNA